MSVLCNSALLWTLHCHLVAKKNFYRCPLHRYANEDSCLASVAAQKLPVSVYLTQLGCPKCCQFCLECSQFCPEGCRGWRGYKGNLQRQPTLSDHKQLSWYDPSFLFNISLSWDNVYYFFKFFIEYKVTYHYFIMKQITYRFHD